MQSLHRRKPLSSNHARELALVTAALLIIALSRIPRIDSLSMNWDEVWSIWQTFGTTADVVRWTPPDWPPLYFLFVDGWRHLAGIEPFVLRMSSLLATLFGAVFTYRAARRLWGQPAALLTMLVFGALGFAIFLSLLVRAYSLLMALTPLALWLSLRYFDRPTTRRALMLAVCCVAMWFLHYTAIFIFIALGIVTLLRYRREIWRWWLPGGIVAVAGMITFITKPDVFETRTAYNGTIALPPLPQALASLYGTFSYPASLIWLAIFILATAVICYRLVQSARKSRNLSQASAVAFLLWLASPALIYVFNSRFGLFQDDRYLWWALPGLIFWIGAGLALLPRRAMPVAAAVLALIALMPLSLDDFQSSQYHDYAPIDYDFALLRQYLEPGDVVLVDPNCGCAPNEVWDYYMRIYFPNGLPFVESPAGYRRVWYVTVDWLRNPATSASVERGRVAGKYFGPPNFLIRLYEAPPDPVGVPFANGMRFHGADVERIATPDGPIYHEGETVKLRLWWTVDHPIDLDYSVGTYVFGQNATAETNAPPQPADAPSETSQWQTGQFYVDERELTLPYPLDPDTYPIWLSVYFWQNPTPITAPGVDDRGLLDVGKVLVQSW